MLLDSGLRALANLELIVTHKHLTLDMQGTLRSFRIPHGLLLRQIRSYTASVGDSSGLRTSLMMDIKTALKTKDTLTATTLRSVLAEVQAADKIHKDGKIGASAIRAFIAKGIIRRHEAASQYDKARRSDLAAKERQEAAILQRLLPPAMSESQIDEILKGILASLPATNQRSSMGQIFKAFYAQVDKSLVGPDLLKRRIQTLSTPDLPSSSST